MKKKKISDRLTTSDRWLAVSILCPYLSMSSCQNFLSFFPTTFSVRMIIDLFSGYEPSRDEGNLFLRFKCCSLVCLKLSAKIHQRRSEIFGVCERVSIVKSWPHLRTVCIIVSLKDLECLSIQLWIGIGDFDRNCWRLLAPSSFSSKAPSRMS